MGALRTSEDGDVVGGEASAAGSDADRAVDAPGRIILDSAPVIARPTHRAPVAPVSRSAPAAPSRGGLGLVIVAYILAAAALGAAIYERFFMEA